jgi:GT2 family glycosyltransferase
VQENCLEKLVAELKLHSNIGAIGPTIKNAQKKDQDWGSRGKVNPAIGMTSMSEWKERGRLPKWSYIPGCSLLTRAQAYDQLGGLPEIYHLYFEETEYCIRLQKANWDLWIEPDAIAIHRVDSLKSGVPARHFAYYFIRNNLTFWKRNFGISIWTQLPRTMYVVLREVILPLRKAHSMTEAWDRFKYACGGFYDGILFYRDQPFYFEKRLFQ